MIEHIGKGQKNAVTREQLIARTGMTDRVVRKNIELLINQGYCICSNSDHKGYFIAATKEEVIHSVNEERKKALTLLRKADKRLDNWYKGINRRIETK